MHIRSFALFALSAAMLSACGNSEAPTQAPAAESKGVRHKLVDLHQGVLHQPERAASVALELLNSDSSGFDAWSLFGDISDPLAGAQGKIERHIESDDQGQFLTLKGESGALFCLLDAKPNTFYSFDSQVRVQGLESPNDEFFGATPWIGEMTLRGSREELIAGGRQDYVYHRELFPTGMGTEGWRERSRIFVTGPQTRMLLVMLSLALTEKVSAGQVSYRSIKLNEVSSQEYLQARLQWAVDVSAAGAERPEDWRSERLVRGNLGGELRPAIVLLPGERLSFDLRLAAGQPRFECGVGFWDPLLSLAGAAPVKYGVKVTGPGGTRSAELEVEANGDRSGTRWGELELDLAEFGGQAVRLELTLEGKLPGMFGAPQVLDRSQPRRQPNVLLVSIDTLRSDHVGAYGASANQTPRIDAFAKSGLLFTEMVAQAPYTLPGHASILSGQHPGVHGLQQPGQLLSPLRSPIMTRILSERGYATQAFTGGGFVNAEFGFARDFDGFVNIDPWRHRESEHFRHLISQTPPAIKRVSRAADQGLYLTQEMVDRYGPEGVKDWITQHKDEPFFLFVHTFAIHDYEPPAGYLNCAQEGCSSEKKDYKDFKLTKESKWQGKQISLADQEHLKHRYDATLRFTDKRFGELLEHLDELGLTEDTIVILTSDHGEEMFERGFIQHGKSLYEELTGVPLIMRIPGQTPKVIEHAAMQVDILPTLLAALGVERDSRIQGIDLLTEGQPERATWSEIDDHFVEIYAYRSPDGWKLIQSPPNSKVLFPILEEWRLFNLNNDPGELHNLAESEPAKLAELRGILEAQRRLNAGLASAFADNLGGELSEATKIALRALGYVIGDEDEGDE